MPILCVLLGHPAIGGAEDYKLQPGDVLRLDVVGAPELSRDLQVGLNGEIVVPLAGQVTAVGRTVEEVWRDVSGALANAYSLESVAGEGVPHQIRSSSVTLYLQEYTPIYVSGDVIRPGAFTFRPGLTARRAVALAGGYGLAALGTSNPHIQILEFEEELQALRLEASALRVEQSRLQAEVDESGFDREAFQRPLEQLFAPIQHLEYMANEARRAERSAYFDRSLAEIERQHEILRSKLEAESEGVAADAEEYERLKALRAEGTITTSRLAEARRSLLFSTTRELETASALADIEREMVSLPYERKRLRLEDRAAMFERLSNVALKLKTIEAQMRSLQQRLNYLTNVEPEMFEEGLVNISIEGRDESVRFLEPGTDAELRPGDLVTIRISDPS